MSASVTRISPVDQARSFGINHFIRAYENGITVEQQLERDDPTSEYPENERKLDAFERVLKAEGIVTNPIPERGVQATTWEEATKTKERRAMMHEFAARTWRSATKLPSDKRLLLSGDSALNTIANAYADDRSPRSKRLTPPVPLDALVARTTGISGQDYRSIYIVDDLNTDAYRLKRVNEGAEIPATTLVTGEHTIQIHKFGRALRATYEQLRRQTVDRIAFILTRMALQAEVDKVSDAMNTIINGDGNANTSATVLTLTALDASAAAGTLTLKGWLTFKSRFTNVYTPDVVLAQEAAMMQLLLLPVNTVNGTPLVLLPGNDLGTFRNIGARFGGAIAYGVTSDAPALKLVAWDGSQVLERVTEIGGNVSEVDNFINNQTQMLTLTEVEGFGVIDANGAKVLNINA